MALNKDKSNKKTILGSLGLIGVLVLKGKTYLLAAFKALAFVKVGWILSPLITIGVYTMLWGLPYALAVFILLLTHEMGHYVWMKVLGLEPKLPIFIPGVGAYVAMTKLPPDEATHAWVAMAGPLVGGVTSALLFWFGVNYANAWLMAAGSTGFFLNLLQLIPAKPFDGGFIIHAIYKWLLIPGTALLLVLTFLFKSILLFVVSIVSVASLFSLFSQHHALAQAQTPKQLSIKPAAPEQRIIIAIAYFSLAGMLAYLYWLASNELVTFMPHHR